MSEGFSQIRAPHQINYVDVPFNVTETYHSMPRALLSRDSIVTTRWVNGDHSVPLVDKGRFGEICHELGFAMPAQERFLGNEVLLARMLKLSKFPEVPAYFKPTRGSNSIGIEYFKSPRQNKDVILSARTPHVLQEDAQIEAEFRYVYYQSESKGPIRIVFQKNRPAIFGDGSRSLGNILARESNIPMRAKIVSAVRNWERLYDIPEKDQQVLLGRTGVLTTGGYESLPADDVVSSLDSCVPGFVRELEEYTGGKLPLMCFDIGVRDLSLLLDRPDMMKVNLVPFEMQMPFSTWHYHMMQPRPLHSSLGFHMLIAQETIQRNNGRISGRD